MTRYTVCSGEDFEPGASYIRLFSPENQAYALFHSWDDTLPSSYAFVTKELSNILSSAERYPPALALASREISRLVFNSAEDFLAEVHRSVASYLRRQPTDGFILASGRLASGNEFTLNHFYWILDVTLGVATWVTEDYFIGTCEIEEFHYFEAIASHFELRAKSTSEGHQAG